MDLLLCSTHPAGFFLTLGDGVLFLYGRVCIGIFYMYQLFSPVGKLAPAPGFTVLITYLTIIPYKLIIIYLPFPFCVGNLSCKFRVCEDLRGVTETFSHWNVSL